MLKRIAILVLLVVVVVLIVASTKPATFSIQRSVVINAGPDKIHPLIDDFHNWNQWSPWAKLDPNMKTTYTGAPSGVGSVYTWEGNSKVGAGRMEVTGVQPAQTEVKIDFMKPFSGHDIADFNLEPQGSATKVTWVMHGPNTFMSKIMSVFVSMDKMIGPDFEHGLADMKTAAEK